MIQWHWQCIINTTSLKSRILPLEYADIRARIACANVGIFDRQAHSQPAWGSRLICIFSFLTLKISRNFGSSEMLARPPASTRLFPDPGYDPVSSLSMTFYLRLWELCEVSSSHASMHMNCHRFSGLSLRNISVQIVRYIAQCDMLLNPYSAGTHYRLRIWRTINSESDVL